VALLLVVSFVLVLVALVTPWWGYSTNATNDNVSFSFLPGSSYNVVCAGSHCGDLSSSSGQYSAIGGSLSDVYEGVLGLVAAAVALVGIAALCTGYSVLARRSKPIQPFLTRLCLVLAPLLVLTAILWTAAGQPGSFPSGATFVGSSSNGASPSTSFWGSNPADGATWGAGAGWYLGTVAVLLLFGVLLAVLLLARHPELSAEPERRTKAAIPAPTAAPRGYAPPPSAALGRPKYTQPPVPRDVAAPAPAAATVRPVVPEAPAPVMVPCPECGTPNLARSRVCSYCQRSLRSAAPA
jgi:hypothetical protein